MEWMHKKGWLLVVAGIIISFIIILATYGGTNKFSGKWYYADEDKLMMFEFEPQGSCEFGEVLGETTYCSYNYDDNKITIHLSSNVQIFNYSFGEDKLIMDNLTLYREEEEAEKYLIEDSTNSDVIENKNEATQTEEKEEEQEEVIKKYTASTYKVGVDIPAGEYVVFAIGGSGYYSINQDANGNDIIDNDNFAYNSIIKVVDGEYLKLSRSYAISIDDVEILDTTESGMFKVGKYLSSGEYKLKANDGESAYYAIMSVENKHITHIVANDIFEGSTYVSVSDGQYLKLSGCTIDK